LNNSLINLAVKVVSSRNIVAVLRCDAIVQHVITKRKQCTLRWKIATTRIVEFGVNCVMENRLKWIFSTVWVDSGTVALRPFYRQAV